MRLWLRLYTEVLNDPKVQKLDGNSFKFWINLLCCAKEYSNDGILPDVPGIAFHLRIKEETAQKYLEKMVESGLVDFEVNCYVIHSWHTRQYESDNDPTALDRKRRERDRKKNVTEMSRVTSRTCHGNVTVTEQIPEQIPDTDTDIERANAPAAPSPAPQKRFQKPTLTDISEYIKQNNLIVDAETFLNHYEGNGWMVGRVKMKDWQRTIQNWNKRELEKRRDVKKPKRDYDKLFAELGIKE